MRAHQMQRRRKTRIIGQRQHAGTLRARTIRLGFILERGRNLPGQCCAKALPDQVQHDVGGGRRPSGGKAISRNDKPVRHDLDRGMHLGEILKILPMDRCAMTIKQPCARQNPRPCINRPDGTKPSGHAPDTRDQRTCRDFRLVVAGNDDQHISPFSGLERSDRRQLDPAGQGHCPAIR
jgi:hypothetical protein